ncbi:hypothetical protein Patl1_21265 [Pistacia atlantica]|uniref:Uncharacterized protein n=1 Tax=Pistacia atlantica TaxID=434234 RepID=A0ACC1BKT8_9ROSI|nr:hypothetical protein Patl1_21265 [Pistacia atlantica]
MVCLNRTNYHKWKGKMKDLLFVKGYTCQCLLRKNLILKVTENGSLSTNKCVTILGNG